MFDFAVSQNQKSPPTGRMIASWIASCLIHLALLIIMIENPQLMRLGTNRWIQALMVYTEPSPSQNWRVVTVLRTSPMQGPSAATLKKYMKNWDKEGSGSTPPIRVRWGGEKEGDAAATSKPTPAVKPVPGKQEPKPLPAMAAGQGAGAPDSGTTSPALVTAAPPSNTVFLPAPMPAETNQAPPKKVTEVPTTITPAATPESNPGTAAAPNQKSADAAKQTAKIFDNAQKAIHSEGNGLFDTKGFPLGDYANMVIERVKGNWSIPSNLRNSQGRTTVIFFIDKDGRFTDARIITPSGNSSLDLAALNAVIGSNPFPPLPKGFPGDHVGAKFVFSYNEHQ
jgi:TonB family protein